jgi:hypothetical protein
MERGRDRESEWEMKTGMKNREGAPTKMEAVPRKGSRTSLPGSTRAIFAMIRDKVWSSDVGPI